MKRGLLTALLLLVAGCHHPQPKMTDAQIAKLRANYPGITDQCVEKLRWGGIFAMPNKIDQCFKMTPSQHWKGLWRNDFEWSVFCAAPATECPNSRPPESTWLDFGGRPPRGAGSAEGMIGPLYALEFIGRKTAYPGFYEGATRQVVLVDRLISIRQVEPAPPQPTAAQTIAREKACEAAGQCVRVEASYEAAIKNSTRSSG